MDQLLGTIEHGVMSVLTARRRRSHRRRITAAATGGALLLVTGAGFAGVTDTPLDRLLSGDSRFAQEPGSSRSDVVFTDATGVEWTATTYVMRGGSIGMSAAPRGADEVGTAASGTDGFVLAERLAKDGPVLAASLSTAHVGGDAHYAVYGTVVASVQSITVTAGGRRLDAMIAADAVTVPVRKPEPSHLTDEGRRVAAGLPSEIRVKTFALPLDAEIVGSQGRIAATVEAVTDDGSPHRFDTILCATAECGPW